MSKAPSPVQDEGSGLIVQALKTITAAYKVGGYLLVAMLAGVFLIVISLFSQSGSQRMAIAVGFLLLVFPLLAALIVYLRPLRDLKRQLDEKAAFLRATEAGVVDMARTVRNFAEAIATNHENMAAALREARGFLNNFPVVANWVDGSEDLSRELIKLSLELRDAATSIENAFRHGDTNALRQSITNAQLIAARMKSSASPRRLIAGVSDGVATQLDVLKNSEALAMLNTGLALLAAQVDDNKDPGKKDSTISMTALLAQGLKALGASNKPRAKEGDNPAG